LASGEDYELSQTIRNVTPGLQNKRSGSRTDLVTQVSPGSLGKGVTHVSHPIEDKEQIYNLKPSWLQVIIKINNYEKIEEFSKKVITDNFGKTVAFMQKVKTDILHKK